MAQYGRLRLVVQDSAGNVVSGASVEVRKQGATVNGLHGGLNTSFTVNDPGALLAADNVQVGTDTSVTRSVSSTTATNVTVGGAGFNSVADDARLTAVNNLPTLYNDAQGAETKTNPLTTDALGVVTCWALVRPYDVLISGSGVTTKLLEDVVPVGNERITSNVYPGAGPGFIFDTERVLTTDDKIISVREATVEKFSVDDDGDVIGAKGTFSGAVASSAGVSGTTGTFSGAVSGTTGTFTGAVSGTTGTFSSDLTARRPYFRNGTALTTADWAISSGWGDTATKFDGSSYGTDQGGLFVVTANGASIAANPTVTLTFKDGAWPGIPIGIGIRSGTSANAGYWAMSSMTTTAAEFQFIGTPVAGGAYGLAYFVFTVR